MILIISDLWLCERWPISFLLLQPPALFNRKTSYLFSEGEKKKSNICSTNAAILQYLHTPIDWRSWHEFKIPDLRLTSSLQLTVASPWSFLALQEYTPPSKLPGLRISREQIPWTQICLYLGSSPMIIWFFIHWILGCRETDFIYLFIYFLTLHYYDQKVISARFPPREYIDYIAASHKQTSASVVSIYVCATWQEKLCWLKLTHSTPPVWGF